MRHRVLAALFCSVLSAIWVAPASAQSDVPDAAALRARINAASGPDNDNYSDTIVGTSDTGQTTEMEYYLGKNHLIVTLRGPVVTMAGTFNGSKWNRDENGITVADDPDPGLAPAEQTKATVERAQVPAAAFVLSVLDPSGYGTRDTIDPSTFLIQRHEAINNRETVVTTYAEYARFGTQMLPATWTVENLATKHVVHYARTQFKIGATTTDDVAVPPVHRITTFPAGVASVDLHPEFQMDGTACVPVVIGGKRLFFYIETGLPSISIDPSIATQLGLRMDESAGAAAVKGGENRSTVIPTMDLNGIQLHDVVASIGKIGSGRSADDPAGFLGFDFFAELVVHIDFSDRQITASDPLRFQAPPEAVAAAIPIRLGHRGPLISVTMDGATSERMGVSTGSNVSLALYPSFALRHPDIARDRHDRTIYSINVPDHQDTGTTSLGTFNDRTGTISDTRIGPLSIKDINANVITTKHEYYSDFDGIIGQPLLSLFSVDFDYAAGRMYLTPKRSARKH